MSAQSQPVFWLRITALLGRWRARWRLARDRGAELNKRVEVESWLLAASAGDRPLPDAETCRWLALRLGVPRRDWTDYHRYPPGSPKAPAGKR